ncbi:hypothetical protein GVN16_12170 [Emticicia sp. CRIBPO]|nr:hypothetical protein [Emticicia sp. CRIBPO]
MTERKNTVIFSSFFIVFEIPGRVCSFYNC